MARKAGRVPIRVPAARLVKGIARSWEREAGKFVSPEVRAHMRAAVREGLLAIAGVCAQILRRAEEGARRARSRVERIPLTGATVRRRRTRNKRGR